MNNNPDLWADLLTWLKDNRASFGYAFAGGAMAALRGVYQGESWKKTCAEAGMCALSSFGIREALIALNWHPDLAFPASVFIGYVGIAAIVRFVSRRVGLEKPVVEKPTNE
jgi:lambda family phage holin